MKTALITGANRGLGLETAKQLLSRGHRVILDAREPHAGQTAAQSLASPHALSVALDLASEASIERCVKQIQYPIDVLVNNAGVYPQGSALKTALETFRAAFEVHFFGVLSLCQKLIPAMNERGFGRVVNVSSGYGSIDEGLQGPAPYSLSKAALNALTLKLASEVRGDVLVNAACPGWVRTRMGGQHADLTPEEGADTLVWLATLPPRGPSGGFFRGRTQIAW